MSFLVGLFVGIGLSQKSKSHHAGGVYLQPMGSHASNPFEKPEAAEQAAVVDADPRDVRAGETDRSKPAPC